MSFWDNVKKMAQPYADDDYDEYDDEEEYFDDYEEPEERPSRRAARRTPAPDPAPAAQNEDEEEEDSPTSFNFPGFDTETKPAPAPVTTGFRGSIVGGSSASNKQEVVLFRPGTFNDTSKAADDLRNRRAVIVNMENVDKDMARRVVDFLSGCVYALDGNVKKIAKSAYLFCPHNMDIVGDLEALQAEAESYM